MLTVQMCSVGSRHSVNFPTGCLVSARGEISPEITCTRSATRATSCGDGQRRPSTIPTSCWRWNRSGVCTPNITTGPDRCRPSLPWLSCTTTGKNCIVFGHCFTSFFSAVPLSYHTPVSYESGASSSSNFLHRQALILDRLLTFLVAFSTLVLKFSFSPP